MNDRHANRFPADRLRRIGDLLGSLQAEVYGLADDLAARPGLPVEQPAAAADREELPLLEERILALFGDGERLSRRAIEEQLAGQETGQVRAVLRALIGEGRLEHHGRARSSSYSRPGPLGDRIVELAGELSSVRRKDIVERWPAEQRSILGILGELVSDGRLLRRGQARGTHYVLPEPADRPPVEPDSVAENDHVPQDPAPAPIAENDRVPQNPATAPIAENDRVPQNPATALLAEIEQASPYLEQMTQPARTAQIAIWAGTARRLQEQANGGAESAELRWVHGRLSGLARQHRTDWIDALNSQWRFDWQAYVLFYQDEFAEELDGSSPRSGLEAEQLAALYRARLEGLSAPTRRSAPADAIALVLEALTVLDPTDPVIKRVEARFPQVREHLQGGPRRSTRSVKPSQPEDAPVEIDAEVLAFTRGRRALIVGGDLREDARTRIEQALGLESLEWIRISEDAPRQVQRLQQRIDGGRVDLVIFLIRYISHKVQPAIASCTAGPVPAVLVNRGYGVASIAGEIRDQLLSRRPAGDRAVAR